MKKQRPFTISALAAFGLGVSFSLLVGCGKKADTEREPVVRPVKLYKLEDRGIERTLELPGQVLANRQAVLGFEVPGLIQGIQVSAGQAVETGQALAKLDDRDYQAALEAAKAQFEFAQAEAERMRALFERDATSRQRLEQGEAALQVSRAQFERAQKAVEDTTLQAPFSGRVAEVLIDDIETVQAKQPVVVLQDLSKLRIEVAVPETFSVLAKPGMTLEDRTRLVVPEVTITVYPDRRFPARVTEFSSLVDLASRTFSATLQFDPPEDLVVLPGMTAKLVFQAPGQKLETGKGFAIPSRAVFSDAEGRGKVWVVDPESYVARAVEVRLGTFVEDRVEIFAEGLKPGDLIATTGIRQLREGVVVKPMEG